MKRYFLAATVVFIVFVFAPFDTQGANFTGVQIKGGEEWVVVFGTTEEPVVSGQFNVEGPASPKTFVAGLSPAVSYKVALDGNMLPGFPQDSSENGTLFFNMTLSGNHVVFITQGELPPPLNIVGKPWHIDPGHTGYDDDNILDFVWNQAIGPAAGYNVFVAKEGGPWELFGTTPGVPTATTPYPISFKGYLLLVQVQAFDAMGNVGPMSEPSDGVKRIGDVTADGRVTSYDAFLVSQHVLKKILLTGIQQKVADVSGGGTVTSYDAYLIVQYSIGKITKFPIETMAAPPLPPPVETLAWQNYPNPFNPETWIPYQLAEDCFVIIKIYSAQGQLVRTLDLGYQRAGFYETKDKAAYWDGKNEAGERVASGIYFYTFQAELAEDFTSAIKKMVILR